MERTLKLTISILVSNRKDTVPKCLESLRPLLEQVDSELIITDTGCDDDLVEYMRQYTDNIIKFQWCNDFAAARNVGLDMARGQWFMFIDDDEWFEDVSELVEFFNSDDERNYEAANYIVRNYHSLQGDSYTEGVAGRIFRVYDDSKFVGKVHEQVKQNGGETKQLFSYAHHYGYVFETEEQGRKHFERNSELLIKEIKENPTCARNYAHIYQEYKMMNKPDIVLDYANKALESVDTTERSNLVSLCSAYIAILWAYKVKDEYENVIKYGEEFLKSKMMTGLARALHMSYLAEAYAKCEQYDKTIECVDAYMKNCHMYNEDRTRYYKEVGPMLNDMYGDERMGLTLNMGILAAIELGMLDKALDYLLSYNWAVHVYMPQYDCLEKFVALIAKSSDEELNANMRMAVRAVGKLFTHIECSNIFLKKTMTLKEENPEGYEKVCSVMALVAGQPGYKSMVEIITVSKKNNREDLCQVYEKVVAREKDILFMENEFFKVAGDKKIPLGEMLCKIDVETWQTMLKTWALVVRNKELAILKRNLDRFLPADSLHMKLLERQIVDILEKRKKAQ